MRNMKGLRIDDEFGEGEIDLPEKFLSDTGLFRADVLRDWILELMQEYSDALNDAFPFGDGRSHTVGLTIGETKKPNDRAG